MSYDIQLYRNETKEREQKLNNENFFENEENLEPFTELQMKELKTRILTYGYILKEKNEYGFNFTHPEYGEALLTDRGLYFTTSFNEDSIFEVGMTVSELTDTEEYQKYDAQNGGWEEF
jgi:hypothetical protein